MIDSWFPFNRVFGKHMRDIFLNSLKICLVDPDMNLFKRLLLLQLGCFGKRSSYYFVWVIGNQLNMNMTYQFHHVYVLQLIVPAMQQDLVSLDTTNSAMHNGTSYLT